MTARKHKHGGWHTNNHAFPARIDRIVVKAPPRESWWTRPVQSRADFDRLIVERSREAGWIGKGLTEDADGEV